MLRICFCDICRKICNQKMKVEFLRSHTVYIVLMKKIALLYVSYNHLKIFTESFYDIFLILIDL